MATGRITRLDRERGFGFLQSERSPDEIYFHHSSVESGGFDQLRPGQHVEFDEQLDPRDPGRRRAVRIRPTEGIGPETR